MNKLRIAAFAVAVALALTGCQGPGISGGESQASGNFEGETIDLVVPFETGGGYDQYARQLAPALEKELGATVNVINKPGAGGLLAINELMRAKPDGTTIEILNMTGVVGSALAEAEGVEFDPAKFSYIGRLASEPDVVITAADGDIKSYEDLKAAADDGGVKFGATGPGSNEYVDPVVLETGFGIKNEIVTGFNGSGAAALSLVQGNFDAYSRSLSSQQPTIDAGDGRPILVLGRQPVKAFPEVPTLIDVADDAKSKKLAEFHADVLESGRTLAAPPNMDENRLAELRKAFDAVVQNKDYIAAAEKAGRPIAYTAGVDVQKSVEGLMDAPQDYINIIKKAYEG
ncbi:Bug family tripartite tricarboxylate transporter substrate binding protein [Prauserella flavalba]|uniref:Tripartite-type tricarboxylate transporter receptor subunit TctC n=1 Tax=Prauserella flavalba TaxID=1477506 RepID=A0A318LJQ3_9PSEU|nr:tripartite tricarboxylate transporter substrate binding protein [Prauserella flavalba]PXY23915.1 hypothetical protein BA062_26905 [Prauserella flavalba]